MKPALPPFFFIRLAGAWRRPALALGLLLAMAGAQAQGFDARWGLRWGQTPAEVQALVQGWQALPPDGELEQFAGRSRLFRHPGFVAQVMGFRQGRLVEVRSFSQLFAEDAQGREGKLAHFGVGLALQARYGEASQVHEVMLPAERHPAEGFYACLKDAGCGLWARSWKHAEAFVVLELKAGKAPGSGWLSLRALEP